MPKEILIHLMHESMALTKRKPTISFTDRINYICEKIKLTDEKLIIDGTGEGEMSINIAKGIIKKLKLNPNQVKIILNVDAKHVLDGYEVISDYTSGVCNWYHWYSKLESKNIDWENIDIHYHVLSLVHRPSLSRALYTKDILDLFGDRALVSFGFNGGIDKSIKDILKPYKLPITIDVFGIGQEDNRFQPWTDTVHSPPGKKLFRCLMNVVLETNDPDNPEIRITEKGFKAFAWHQLPIFVSGKGYVERMRKLGFDVFDDVLDGHSYNESHPGTYQLRVLSLLKKMYNKYPTVDDIKDLRKSLYPRLVYNNKLLADYVSKDQSGWNVSH
jgi:hypothetical protein